jgi:hypothetical protein
MGQDGRPGAGGQRGGGHLRVFSVCGGDSFEERAERRGRTPEQVTEGWAGGGELAAPRSAPALPEESTTAAAVTFRTLVPDLATLSDAERALLSEWLDRVSGS